MERNAWNEKIPIIQIIRIVPNSHFTIEIDRCQNVIKHDRILFFVKKIQRISTHLKKKKKKKNTRIDEIICRQKNISIP